MKIPLIFFFIIHVKACAMLCPHQPPTRNDNTVSVAEGSIAIPGATKQLLLPDRVFRRIIYIYIYIYIYTPDHLKTKIHFTFIFLVQFVIFKNPFTFGHWCHHMLTVTISWCYVITQEWWFQVDLIHAEDFLLSNKSNLMHIAPWSEDDLRQLSTVVPIFERNLMTECPRKPWQPTSIGITWHIQPFSTQSARRISYWFFFHLCASSQFSYQRTVNSMRRTLFFESDHATMFGRFSVWMIWTGNCRDVLRSTETFQSLAPFSNFILGFFYFLTVFPFLEKLNYGFLGCDRLLVCCFTLCF